jgi:hypothetical protein
MQTDWYTTERAGTYVAVPAGTPLHAVRLPADVHAPLDLSKAVPLATNVDATDMAWQYNQLGIDDCLRYAGVCVLRT